MKSLKSVLRKLFVACAALGISAGVCNAQYGSPEISIASNTLCKILPAAQGGGYAAWATNTAYAQGQMVKSPGGMYHMCLVAGTSTNDAAGAPSGLGKSVDGTVTWVSAMSRKRSGLSVQHSGTGAGVLYVFLHFGAGTNLSQVVSLLPGGGGVLIDKDTPQEAIWALATSNTTATVFEY